MNNILFSIDVLNSRIYINNVPQPLTSSSLASNVRSIFYSTQDGGSIIYNDRPPIAAQFSDPSPYQSYINAWITTAAAGSPALTLSQAQSIKAGLVDALWSVKSNAPVSVATSLGTYSFDVTPNDPGSVVNLLPAITGIISQFAATDTAISAAVAAIISSVNTTVVGGTNGNFNGQAASADAAFLTLFNYTNTNITTSNDQNSTSTPLLTFTDLASGSVGGASASFTAPTTLPALTSPVKMLPIGSTSYPNFTLADLFTVLAAAQTQQANEAAVRATKQAAVSALTTIPSVISYDATTGW